MTDQLSPLAVQNAPLLRALKQGDAGHYTELAARAGITDKHVHRKLDALENAGLIVRDPDGPVHAARLTDAAEKALLAVDVYEGRIAAGEAPPETAEGVRWIPLDRLRPWAGNPRKHIPPKSILDMAQSVGDRGIDQPITVRTQGDGFEVLFGQRRWRGTIEAARQGWISGDPVLVPCHVRELTDAEAEDAAGVENLQREDMHWADLAKYFLHMMDERHLSGPALERMFGGRNYSARKIQDYAKIARELPEDVFALAYEPEFLDEAQKQSNPRHLTYTKARGMVGDKQEKPALELTPKLRLTLLELIAAGIGPVRLGETIVTRLHTAPVGGPMGTLSSDRKLIAFGFEAREVVCRIKITEELAKYLQQIGWYEDQNACLRTAREAVVGEMQAAAMEPGEFVTPELNAPKPQPQPEPQPPAADPPAEEPLPASQRRVLREMAARSLHEHRLADGYVKVHASALEDPDFRGLYDLYLVLTSQQPSGLFVTLTRKGRDHLHQHNLVPEAKSANSCVTPWLRTDQDEASPEDETGDRPDDAHPGEPIGGFQLTPETGPVPSTPAQPKAALAEPTLPAMLQIVLVELAHRIATQGIEHSAGTWAVDVLPNYYKDTRSQQLVNPHRMIAFLPAGHKTRTTVTKAGLAWLAENASVSVTATGKPQMDDGALMALQRELGFSPDAGAYSTHWLNDPAPEPSAEPEPPAAAPSAPSAPPAGRQVQQLPPSTEEARIIGRMAGALREAREAIGRAKTRKLTPQEAVQLHALIDSALETAAPYVAADAQGSKANG